MNEMAYDKNIYSKLRASQCSWGENQ